MEMQSHLFLSFYLKSCHFFLLRGKLRFLQIFISVAWLLPMNVFKLEGFLFFLQNFPKDVFGRKFLFPWGRNGDAKVVFFLAGSFSRNREVFESDGLVRRFFFFLIADVDEEFRCFLKSVPILEVIRRTKLMSIFRCVKNRSEVFSFFFKVVMSSLAEFS